MSNTTSEKKTYVGSGKFRETPYGQRLKLSFSRKDIDALAAALDDNGWVRVDIQERRAPSKTGQTHYGVIDTWKPDARREDPQPDLPPTRQTRAAQDEQAEDAPF